MACAIGDKLSQQQSTQAATLEIRAQDDGELRLLVVGIGMRTRQTQYLALAGRFTHSNEGHFAVVVDLRESCELGRIEIAHAT